MGFQHALAMLGGIVSVPIIVGGPFDAQLSNAEVQYLISAGLISSGLLSLIQIYRIKLGNTGYYMGTGMVSVLGTSFTFVPIARTSIDFMMKEDSNNPCESDAVCGSFACIHSPLHDVLICLLSFALSMLNLCTVNPIVFIVFSIPLFYYP